jgi:hypothetical protein
MVTPESSGPNPCRWAGLLAVSDSEQRASVKAIEKSNESMASGHVARHLLSAASIRLGSGIAKIERA